MTLIPSLPIRSQHATQAEEAVRELIAGRLRDRGWRPRIVPHTGYGGPGWVRVLARVLLAPQQRRQPGAGRPARGWRRFATLPVADVEVVIEVEGGPHTVRTDRGGYVDCVVESALPAGWRAVRLTADDAEAVDAAVRIVDETVRLGVVSDIDDTVMVTALPRPLLAAWNTFVLDEHARAAVPGMAVLYERLMTAHAGIPVVYLSTGAWNVAPALTRFLSRHLYPNGPLLLTDWGPTADRWFRSGKQHKSATLARLAREFPHIKWVLIGDDGQHDPEIYAEFAATHPDNVAAVAIRRLSPAEAVLAGLPAHLSDALPPGLALQSGLARPGDAAVGGPRPTRAGSGAGSSTGRPRTARTGPSSRLDRPGSADGARPSAVTITAAARSATVARSADVAHSSGSPDHPWLYAPDGAGLWRLLKEAGIL